MPKISLTEQDLEILKEILLLLQLVIPLLISLFPTEHFRLILALSAIAAFWALRVNIKKKIKLQFYSEKK